MNEIFKKFYIRPPVSIFLFLTLHLMLDGLLLLRKGDFRRARSSKLIFKVGIFGGARHFGCNPT